MRAAVLLLAALGVAAPVQPAERAHDEVVALRSGGRDRTYLLHVPPGHPPRAGRPLVLLLRGRGGTAAGLARISQFDTLADREGIVAVYPEGVERSWGDGRGTSPAEQQHVDDVGFLAAVIDDARDERPWTRRACT